MLRVSNPPHMSSFIKMWPFGILRPVSTVRLVIEVKLTSAQIYLPIPLIPTGFTSMETNSPLRYRKTFLPSPALPLGQNSLHVTEHTIAKAYNCTSQLSQITAFLSQILSPHTIKFLKIFFSNPQSLKMRYEKKNQQFRQFLG